MNRLKHSRAGYVRYMQMSATGFFAFTEGKVGDRYFYGKICASPCQQRAVSYQLITAAELSGSGGKQSLLAFYSFLCRTNKLISDFKGKKTAAVFFLDKDLDDIMGTQVQSDHAIYTPTYDVEGTVYRYGRISEAIAATVGFDEQEIAAMLGDEDQWRHSCAELWKEWIVICAFCRIYGIKGLAGYGVFSPLNDPANARPNAQKLADRLREVSSRSGMQPVDFTAAHAGVEARVTELFNRARHDEVFKGKWYLAFISATLKSNYAGRELNLKGLHSGVLGALCTTIDYGGAWTAHWTEKLSSIAEQIQ